MGSGERFVSRHPRYFAKDLAQHLIQRGNNRTLMFKTTEDYVRFGAWLAHLSAQCGVAVHGYVFMTNHFHLLVTAERESSIPSMMQRLGSRYVPYFNRRYQRTGTLWDGRYRPFPVDTDRYFLNCLRYIELNPVRAGIVERPEKYEWSSYRAHAWGEPDSILQLHPLIAMLGSTATERQLSYRMMCDSDFSEDELHRLRDAAHFGDAIGGPEFVANVDINRHRPGMPQLTPLGR